MESTGRRIKYVRVTLGMTQEAFASFLGDVTRGAVGNWERDQGIKTENLELIADRTHVSMDWLAKGRGPAPRPTIMGEADLSKPRDAGEHPSGGIPNLVIHGGMGGGGLEHVELDGDGAVNERFLSGYWNFPPPVAAGIRNPKSIHALPVIGDSMSPTLESGSVVFVDSTHTHPAPEDIYALDYGDGLLIKRVKLIPNTSRVRIISDNERYGADEMEREQLHVYGRVVGYFRWRG